MNPHDYSTLRRKKDEQDSTTNADEEDDPVTAMIRRSGCLEEHYDVIECKYEKQDWRLCQDVVKAFRDCMEKSRKKGK